MTHRARGPGPTMQAVLAILQDADVPLVPSALAVQVDRLPSHVRHILRRLERRGLAVDVGDGGAGMWVAA